MDTLESIAKRYAVRSYLPKQIKPAELTTILEAGYFTPVGMGQFENLNITVVQQPEHLQALADVAKEVLNSPHGNPTYDAPTVLVLSSKVGLPESLSYANVSVLAQTLMIAASSQGVGSTYIFSAKRIIDDNAELRTMLQLPKDFTPLIFVALGYANDQNKRVIKDNPRIATNFA